MRQSKKVVSYSTGSGVGLVRDARGRISVVYNSTAKKPSALRNNAKVTVRSYQGRDYTT